VGAPPVETGMKPAAERLMSGLSSSEARKQFELFGRNVPVTPRPGQRLLDLARLLLDPMALMLAVAGVAYLLMGERLEGVVLLGALIPVLGIDVILDIRSQAALKKLAATVGAKARVIRDGREQEISSELLVPGDLIVLGEGDIVHADATVITASNLALDESQLTGEAEPQSKRAAADSETEGGEASQVYAGSRVLAGQGISRVTATGASSRYGRIAGLVAQATPERTLLERKVAVMVRSTALAGVALSVGVFALEMFRATPLGKAFLYAITLAMASVGEEFVLVLTLFLSVGAYRLSRKSVLVRRISCVETLGATTVICLDKTGTLTLGSFELSVHAPLVDDLSESRLLEFAILACEPQARDSIEAVIVRHCAEHGVEPARVHGEWRLEHDYDFDSRGKHMSHVWGRANGTDAIIVAKGALEGILEHCSIDSAARERAIRMNTELAARGMRVLAVAGRASASLADFTGVRGHDERALTLYGLLGFNDPVRPGVPAAVAECQRAGVRLKLVTGDHPLTAHAIADATGLAHRDEGIITGPELDRAGPQRLREIVRENSIFARTRPEQKYAIVDALIEDGEIVAMTGDGINDAPALRRANIGVSMGSKATEVARAAAGLVLLNDDFGALVDAIRDGRRLFLNIQKTFRYLIGFKVMLVGMAFGAPLFDLPILVTPLNVVWLELIVHSVSALVFESREVGEDVMGRPPRDPARAVVRSGAALRSGICGAILALGALGVFVHFLPSGEAYARSSSMLAAVGGGVLLIFAELAGERAWWKTAVPRDARFWTICVAAVATPVLFAGVPVFAEPLGLAPLGWNTSLAALALAVVAVGWRSLGWRTTA
jgi:P-type Ca2+ transporter type 2C